MTTSSRPKRRLRPRLRIRLLPRVSFPRLPFPRIRLRWPSLTFFALAFLLASLGAIVGLLNSDLLDIKSVRVDGTEVISEATVKQLVSLEGEHVLLADFEAARQRIAALPMVKEVTIERDWPNGIRVVIVERRVWGRWRAEHTVWPIDADGVVLEGAAPPYEGPIVNQISALPTIKAGAIVDTSAVLLVERLHRQGAPLPLPSIVTYEWSLSDGLVIITEHGRIVFGDANGFDYKYAIWDALEREAKQRGEPLLFADLRFGLRPHVEIGLNVGRDIRNSGRTTASISE